VEKWRLSRQGLIVTDQHPPVVNENAVTSSETEVSKKEMLTVISTNFPFAPGVNVAALSDSIIRERYQYALDIKKSKEKKS